MAELLRSLILVHRVPGSIPGIAQKFVSIATQLHCYMTCEAGEVDG